MTLALERSEEQPPGDDAPPVEVALWLLGAGLAATAADAYAGASRSVEAWFRTRLYGADLSRALALWQIALTARRLPSNVARLPLVLHRILATSRCPVAVPDVDVRCEPRCSHACGSLLASNAGC